MKRLVIIVEGYTEYYFVTRILKKHLPHLHIEAINLQGGNISVELVINSVKKVISNFDYVTTLIDYYGFNNPNQTSSADELENQMSASIAKDSFLPYLQQHEFEALLFANKQMIEEKLGSNNQIQKITSPPEEINHDNPPSKRLLNIFPQFIKTSDGIAILESTDWNLLRKQCPRFSHWIQKLENLPRT